MKTDVIIYGRVSTQIQEYENQVSSLKEVCKKEDYNLVEVFTEKISGAKKIEDRNALSKLIDYVRANKNIKGVLVSELSRLGRNNADVLYIIKELTDLKVWVYAHLNNNLKTLNDDYTQNENANLIIGILSSISEHERKTIKKRSIQGLRQSVLNQSRWVGGSLLPYGYKRVNKKLVIEKDESEIIKRIFNLYLEGKGTQIIANILNKDEVKTRYNLSLKNDFNLTYRKGIKKGKIKEKINKDDFKWKDGTIYGILTNKVYIGKKEGKGNLQGVVLYSPPIIDEEVFNEVQIKLKSKNIERKTRFFYLFQNKLYCGRCKRTYHAHKRAPKEENKVSKDSRYICLSKRYKEKCDNYGIGISKINDGVWSVLRYNDEEIKNILELNNRDVEQIKETILKLNLELDQYKEELKNNLSQEEELVKKSISGKITDSIYDKLYNELVKERSELDDKIEDLEKLIKDKKQFYRKRNDINLQIRSIKENKRTLKKTIDEVVREIKIYPVFNHNLNEYRKLVKGDKFVFVEIYTYLNETTPLVFCVSQRSQLIITPKIDEYRKEDCCLMIGGVDEVEGEEEAADVSIRNLYHLSILD